MANSFYTAYKQVLLGDGAITGFSVPDMEGGDQRIILLDSADYIANLSTHQDLVDVAAAARVATVALTGEAVVDNVYDANDAVFTAVTGDQSELLLLYEHTGVEGTSLLIALYDTFTSGMPVTPNGGDINVVWNASGIFTL